MPRESTLCRQRPGRLQTGRPVAAGRKKEPRRLVTHSNAIRFIVFTVSEWTVLESLRLVDRFAILNSLGRFRTELVFEGWLAGLARTAVGRIFEMIAATDMLRRQNTGLSAAVHMHVDVRVNLKVCSDPNCGP
jgi:hypothetical protein